MKLVQDLNVSWEEVTGLQQRPARPNPADRTQMTSVTNIHLETGYTVAAHAPISDVVDGIFPSDVTFEDVENIPVTITDEAGKNIERTTLDTHLGF